MLVSKLGNAVNIPLIFETRAVEELKELTSIITEQENQTIVKTVRRWGGANSNAVLDPGNKYFHLPDIEGFIGYLPISGCAITIGDPICAHSDIPQLAQSFHQYCEKKGWNTIWITTTPQFAQWAMDTKTCKGLIEMGIESFTDPHCDPRKRPGADGCLVRKKNKHALREGVVIKELLSHDPLLEQAIEQIPQQWLQNRQGPQAYLSRIRLFEDRIGKRWIYAQKGERIVAIVELNQLQSHQGWFFNHLMRTPNAPPGTQELLVTATLEILANEECHYASFGFTPKKQLEKIEGFGRPATWLTKNIYSWIMNYYHLEGMNKFWEKFHFQSRPTFVLFRQAQLGISEGKALMRALHATEYL